MSQTGAQPTPVKSVLIHLLSSSSKVPNRAQRLGVEWHIAWAESARDTRDPGTAQQDSSTPALADQPHSGFPATVEPLPASDRRIAQGEKTGGEVVRCLRLASLRLAPSEPLASRSRPGKQQNQCPDTRFPTLPGDNSPCSARPRGIAPKEVSRAHGECESCAPISPWERWRGAHATPTRSEPSPHRAPRRRRRGCPAGRCDGSAVPATSATQGEPAARLKYPPGPRPQGASLRWLGSHLGIVCTVWGRRARARAARGDREPHGTIRAKGASRERHAETCVSVRSEVP